MNWFLPSRSRPREQQQQQPRPQRPLAHVLLDPFGLILRPPQDRTPTYQPSQRPPPPLQPTYQHSTPDYSRPLTDLLTGFLIGFLRPWEPHRQTGFFSEQHYRDVLEAVQVARPQTQQQFDAAAEAAIKAPHLSREQVQAAADAVLRERERDQPPARGSEPQVPATQPASRVPEPERRGTPPKPQELPRPIPKEPAIKPSHEPTPEPAEVPRPEAKPIEESPLPPIPTPVEPTPAPEVTKQFLHTANPLALSNWCVTLAAVPRAAHLRA